MEIVSLTFHYQGPSLGKELEPGNSGDANQEDGIAIRSHAAP
jgi:hypothetical protein